MIYRTRHSLAATVLPLLMGGMLSTTPLAQPSPTPEEQAHEQQALENDAAIDRDAALPDSSAAEVSESEPADAVPPETHATVEAPPELAGLASREPERFIGKTMVLSDGSQNKTIGPVFAVRQRKEDQLVYFIVNATEYFNSPTQYAIAVKNVDRLEQNTLITPAAPGMHLLGMQYYAQDYEDIKTPITAPSLE